MQESLFSRQPEKRDAIVAGVSKVVEYIDRLIRGNSTLSRLRVRGEVSEYRLVPAGHVYFSLKENADILKCVVWSSDLKRLEPFKDGDEIIAGGDFGTFNRASSYQLFVKHIEHTGIGRLYAQFEALKEKFRREGLFEPERKRAMPAFPLRVAVVSARGKGAEDFEQTMRRRAPHIAIDFVETRVQGDGAEIDIAEAIDKASRLDVDVIVLTRGGGAYEDLFPFNLEPVVRAILRAKRPVLSAIGHTADQHVSDLVADYCCETPSNAAQYFGNLRDAAAARVRTADQRLGAISRTLLNDRRLRTDMATLRLNELAQRLPLQRRDRLASLERRLNAQTPKSRLDERARRLHAATAKLDGAVRAATERARGAVRDTTAGLARAQTLALRSQRERVRLAEAKLRGFDPGRPLSSGYAIVRYKGKTLRDASAVSAGERIEAELERGTLIARVESAGDMEHGNG